RSTGRRLRTGRCWTCTAGAICNPSSTSCPSRAAGRTWAGSSTTTSCTPSRRAAAPARSPPISATVWRASPIGSASTSRARSRWSHSRRSLTRSTAEPLSWYPAGPKEVFVGASDAEYSDVLIIGAGISGIGAAYRIHERNPQLTYTILERRERIGGTWDLFRYPGIRSDSDIFTLSFPFEPWTREENVAEGDNIREYLAATA